MKKKILSILLCMVFICTLSLPVYADSDSSSGDGYSAIISDIPTTCPTCGEALHASWRSTSGAEVELQISEAGKITIPAGAGVYAHFKLYCTNCGYSKSETRILGLDWGSEHPGSWEVKKAPSGIGRKDLPGYADDNGTPAVNADGKLATLMCHSWSRAYQSYDYLIWQCSHSSGTLSDYCKGYMEVEQSSCDTPFKVTGNWRTGTSSGFYYKSRFYLIAPISGYYEVPEQVVGSASWESTRDSVQNRDIKVNVGRKFYQKGSAIECFIYVSPTESVKSFIFRISKTPYVTCEPYDTDYLQVSNSLTINNNTWNGNIYVDNTNNLTYIYPEYTTINENNETVTNISTNPIIYNSETNQYYTYDSTTNNYYYITYVTNPTPSPSPSPSPDPDNPDVTPTPTPGGNTGGGSTSTPETGDKDNSGSSGSSWNPFKWLTDLLKDIVETILKGLWKLLTSIFGFILWLLSLLFKLFPWMPNSGILALCAGVVVVTVIRIIKFITGR